jgi:anti-sigma factor RsiW
MNNSYTAQLVDETLDAYVEWLDECAEVRDAYRRWSTAPTGRATDAFDEYLAALDNEEHAADLYAQLIRRIRQRVSVRPWNQRTKRPRWPPRP